MIQPALPSSAILPNLLPSLVFFIPTLLVGGAERHTVDLCERLRAKGFTCRIVVHGSFRSDVITHMKGADDAIFLNLRGMSDFSGWVKTWRVLRDLKPDIVIAINQSPFIVAVVLRLFLWKKFKLTCIFHTTKMQAFEHYQEKLLKLGAPWLDLMIYVGGVQKMFWDRRGLKPKKAKIIFNGIDLERFKLTPSVDIRAQLGIQHDEFVLGIVASFRPEKNHAELVKALAVAQSKGITARVLMIGEGVTRCEIEKLAHDLGVLDKIIFTGEQSDVYPYIKACNMGVLCSQIETFPLSVIEFLASGVPVIASNVGGLPEIIEHGVNGLLYESGDADDLAAAILRCSDAKFRTSLTEHAQNSSQRFCVERMSDRYANDFLNICHL